VESIVHAKACHCVFGELSRQLPVQLHCVCRAVWMVTCSRVVAVQHMQLQNL